MYYAGPKVFTGLLGPQGPLLPPPRPLFPDCWSDAEDPAEDSEALGNGRATKKEGHGSLAYCVEESCPLTRNTCWNFIRMRNKLLLCLALFIEAVSLSDYYSVHCSLSRLENHQELERQSESCPLSLWLWTESCWWACDFGPARLSPSFLGVPARAMGLLRADFWFCHWSFPWSLITVWFLLLLTFCPARSGEWFFPQVTRAFAPALNI